MGAEQRLVRWCQCLIKKWSCVDFQFQFHTQRAYKPTYMAHDPCYMLYSIVCTDIKFNHTNSVIHFSGLSLGNFDFFQWLCVCAVKIHASCFGNSFSKWLGHACHIWYSLGLMSLTHNHSTPAGPVRICGVMTGMFDRKWKGRVSAPKH